MCVYMITNVILLFMSKESGVSLGISTSNFLSQSPVALVRYTGGFISHPYVPEVEMTADLAQKNGVKIEYVQRKGASREVRRLLDGREHLVQSAHGAIFWDLITATKAGWEDRGRGMMGIAVSPGSSFLALDTVQHGMTEIVGDMSHFDGQVIVLHPEAALKLHQNNPELIEAAKLAGIKIAIEPDFRRDHESKSFLWRSEHIRALADMIGVSTWMDPSHTLISLQPDQRAVYSTLCNEFEILAGADEGIAGMHWNGAVPDSEHPERIHTHGLGAIPVSADSVVLPRRIYEQLVHFSRDVELYATGTEQTLLADVELYSLNGMDPERAVVDSLESFGNMRKIAASMSFPHDPTFRPSV